MPVVLRIDGFRVVIYTNDHDPAHVHVMGGGDEVLFNLNCPDGPITMRKVFDIPERVVNELRKKLDLHIMMLCGEWVALHD